MTYYMCLNSFKAVNLPIFWLVSLLLMIWWCVRLGGAWCQSLLASLGQDSPIWETGTWHNKPGAVARRSLTDHSPSCQVTDSKNRFMQKSLQRKKVQCKSHQFLNGSLNCNNEHHMTRLNEQHISENALISGSFFANWQFCRFKIYIYL